jgi:hypothetical protein
VTFAVTERKMKLLKRQLLSPTILTPFNQACFIGRLLLSFFAVVVVVTCFPPLHNNQLQRSGTYIYHTMKEAQGIQSPPEVVRLFRCKNASFGDVFDVDAPHPNEILSVQVSCSDSDNRGGDGSTSCSYPEAHHSTVDYDEETGIVVGCYYSMDGPITSSSSLSKHEVNKKEGGGVSSSLSSPCDTCKQIVPFPFVFIFLCVLFLLGIGEMLREVSARSLLKSHDE